MGGGLKAKLGGLGEMGRSGVCFAVVVSILNWDVDRDEVVADDEQDEQEDAIANEHIEEGKSEAQKLQTFGVFAERDLSLLYFLLTAVAHIVRLLIIEAHLGGLAVHLSLLPVR